MKILLFAALVFSSLRLSGQYTGGNGKGEGLVVRNSTFLAVNLNAYQSGFGDGTGQTIAQNIALNTLFEAYTGGSNDGNGTVKQTNTALFVQNHGYQGGEGRGEGGQIRYGIKLAPCDGIRLAWNGNESVAWSQTSNWDCGSTPTASSIVSIPAAMPRYPSILTGNFTIKDLIMGTNTRLFISQLGKLTVTGQ